MRFQSTPPVKAATSATHGLRNLPPISIHAAREGGDSISAQYSVIRRLFQSTPPVKAATRTYAHTTFYLVFQSTPPVKAATSLGQRGGWLINISIHAAREGGDLAVFAAVVHRNHISIHAAREGGDAKYSKQWAIPYISIHAAREGGDVRGPNIL